MGSQGCPGWAGLAPHTHTPEALGWMRWHYTQSRPCGLAYGQYRCHVLLPALTELVLTCQKAFRKLLKLSLRIPGSGGWDRWHCLLYGRKFQCHLAWQEKVTNPLSHKALLGPKWRAKAEALCWKFPEAEPRIQVSEGLSSQESRKFRWLRKPGDD